MLAVLTRSIQWTLAPKEKSMAGSGSYHIADIHIGRAYDRRDPEGELHYETFGRLAEFFGRNTPVHRHYCFYQVHLLTKGEIHLNLDGVAYSGKAPAIIYTPPAAPHAFYTDDFTDGFVLTIRQDVVRRWLQATAGQWPENFAREPVFLDLATCAEGWRGDYEALRQSAELLRDEYDSDKPGRAVASLALAQFMFVALARLVRAQNAQTKARMERSPEVEIFLNFCDLVEMYFRERLTLGEYARQLGVTETRLNDISRRIANQSAKEVAHERVLQEARRLLRFTAIPIGEICYQLGFSDPAYFSRFFTNRTGQSPSQFRAESPG